MAKASDWASRVAAWRASGETSEAFCEGRDFTPGGLRHWAHRLGKTRAYKRRKPQQGDVVSRIRMARVERMPSEALSSAPAADGRAASLMVEVGVARVMVPTGFDPATLAALLDVLDGRGGAR